MQLYKRILVTLDCSPVDEVIITHVTELALQNRAELTLLHVVHSHTLDQDRVLRQQANEALQTYQQKIDEQGIAVRKVIRRGEPDQEILKEIEKHDYDLVAMATHGHSFIGDILFGSVSRTLKHKIDIPLLLIKGNR